MPQKPACELQQDMVLDNTIKIREDCSNELDLAQFLVSNYRDPESSAIYLFFKEHN